MISSINMAGKVFKGPSSIQCFCLVLDSYHYDMLICYLVSVKSSDKLDDPVKIRQKKDKGNLVIYTITEGY